MQRSTLLEEAEKREATSVRYSIFNKAAVSRIAIASALTVVVIVLLVISVGAEDPPPANRSAAPTSAASSPVPPPSAPPTAVRKAPAPAPSPALPSFATDVRGYLNAAARCAPDQSAAAIGRTEKSLVVICNVDGGRFEYKGVRLSLGAGVSVGDVARNADGFVARNEDTTYIITSKDLVIQSAKGMVTREPMVQYVLMPAHPSASPVAPAAPPPPAPRQSSVPRAAPPPPVPPRPSAQPPANPLRGYPPLPLTAHGTGDGMVRFNATSPWSFHYVVQCPPGVALQGSINAGASYMRYHVELRGGPDGRVEGLSPTTNQSGPIVVVIALTDQRCGWEVSA
jgi:hypothetical protein